MVWMHSFWTDRPEMTTAAPSPDSGRSQRRLTRSDMIMSGWLLLLETESGKPEIRRVSTRDVSEGGAKIVSLEPLPSDVPWFVRFTGNGGPTKFIECEVRHVDVEVVPSFGRKETRRHFYGIQFRRLFDVEAMSDECLRATVRELLTQTTGAGTAS
jgi:hypothetical protein